MSDLPGKLTHLWQGPPSHPLKRVMFLSKFWVPEHVSLSCVRSPPVRGSEHLFFKVYFVSRLEVLTFSQARVVFLSILTGVEGGFCFGGGN